MTDERLEALKDPIANARVDRLHSEIQRLWLVGASAAALVLSAGVRGTS